jgi:hypothetical protein
MIRKTTAQLYYPKCAGLELFVEQNGLSHIILDFNGPSWAFQKTLKRFSEIVSDKIAALEPLQQKAESESFFIYLLGNPRRDAGPYFRGVLDYFHTIGFLRFKKWVFNDCKYGST